MYCQLLTILLLCLTCNGYEDDDLQQALGGGLSQGMDDLMESLGQAIDGLVDMAEGKSVECVYKCENGNVTVLMLTNKNITFFFINQWW